MTFCAIQFALVHAAHTVHKTEKCYVDGSTEHAQNSLLPLSRPIRAVNLNDAGVAGMRVHAEHSFDRNSINSIPTIATRLRRNPRRHKCLLETGSAFRNLLQKRLLFFYYRHEARDLEVIFRLKCGSFDIELIIMKFAFFSEGARLFTYIALLP
jgi:hypothetical protein